MSEREINERFKITPAVYLILLNDNNQVYLMRRYNTGYEDGNYSLPAGHLEWGEQFSGTAYRELREETGIEVNEKKFVSPRHIMSRVRAEGSHRIDVFYVLNISSNTKPEILEPDKCDDAGWYTIDELPNNTIPYIAHALKMVFNNPDQITWSEFGIKENE